MQFSGEGFVVVQPAELLPPYNAMGANPSLVIRESSTPLVERMARVSLQRAV